MNQSIYQEGYRAYQAWLNGTSDELGGLFSCPYPTGSPERATWLAGFNQAETDRPAD